jgi:hypothetical protein
MLKGMVMELRDTRGLTEAEFLAQYRQKDYPRPSFTVDIAVFSKGEDGIRWNRLFKKIE